MDVKHEYMDGLQVIGPVNAVESYFLDCLIEECSEVIHAATKIKRFGWGNFHPEKPYNNNEGQLSKELTDLRAMVQLIQEVRQTTGVLRTNVTETRKHKVEVVTQMMMLVTGGYISLDINKMEGQDEKESSL